MSWCSLYFLYPCSHGADDQYKTPRRELEQDEASTIGTTLDDSLRRNQEADVLDEALSESSLQASGDHTEFSELLDMVTRFPDSTDMVTSLLPGRGTEFPEPLDRVNQFPDSAEMFDSLVPGGGAEFPEPLDMVTQFPDSAEMFDALVPSLMPSFMS